MCNLLVTFFLIKKEKSQCVMSAEAKPAETGSIPRKKRRFIKYGPLKINHSIISYSFLFCLITQFIIIQFVSKRNNRISKILHMGTKLFRFHLIVSILIYINRYIERFDLFSKDIVIH